jgi:hypothetical protein
MIGFLEIGNITAHSWGYLIEFGHDYGYFSIFECIVYLKSASLLRIL